MPEDYVDLDAAAAAAKELLEIGEEPDGEPEEDVEQSEEVETDAPQPDETTEEESEDSDEDFIPRADLEALLEGLEGEPRERVITAYKSFQRLSTKSRQESAELRRAFDGVDPADAKRAYEFVQNLGTDPQFALQVHQELSAALEDAGMSPAAASRAAAEAIEDKVSESTSKSDDLDEYADNPFVQELRATKARLDQFESEAKRREAEAAQQAETNARIQAIEAQHQEIRRTRDDLDDEDMESIFRIGASTGGDLMQALEIFDAMNDRIVTNYVARKKKAPKGGGLPRSSASHSETPVEILNTDQAHKLAVERAKMLLSQDD